MSISLPMPGNGPSKCAAALYSDHNGWLKQWLQQHLGCADRAADLAQDTFVRILLKDTVPSIEKPRAYLSTIARGLVLNYWRRQALEQAWLDMLATQPVEVYPSEEEKELMLEKLQQLAAALDGLPVRCKRIFLMARLDGLSYQQIAVELDITVNVVQKAMSKAMANCYRILYE